MNKYTYETVRDEFENKNYNLLSTEYINCKEKLSYICNKHKDKGIQYITFDSIKSGKGCKYCGIEKSNIKPCYKRTNINDVIDYFNTLDNVKYVGYSFDTKRLRIKYLCSVHVENGIQEMDYNNILRSKFLCKSCRREYIKKQDFENELFSLNPDIELLNEYHNEDTLVDLLCKNDGHKWSIKPSTIIRHPTCPKCRCTISQSEKMIMNILHNHNIKFEFQKRIIGCKDKRILPFDFYLTEYNILIEYDGEHHYRIVPHGNQTQKEQELRLIDIIKKDKIKTTYCLKNNIPLIRIPYWEKDNMEYFLIQELQKLRIEMA